MRSTIVAFAAFAGAISIASANYATCTANGQRCAGAPGKPYVPYAACCDAGYVCIEKSSPGPDEWGQYCLKQTKKCYGSGERCMGAVGHPYVHYMSCCSATDECVKDAAMGWGSFCKSSGATPAPSVYTAPATTAGTVGPVYTAATDAPPMVYTAPPADHDPTTPAPGKYSAPPAHHYHNTPAPGMYTAPPADPNAATIAPTTMSYTAPTTKAPTHGGDYDGDYSNYPRDPGHHTKAPSTTTKCATPTADPSGYTAPPSSNPTTMSYGPTTAKSTDPTTAMSYGPTTTAPTVSYKTPKAEIPDPVCALPAGGNPDLVFKGPFEDEVSVATANEDALDIVITESACGYGNLTPDSLSAADAASITAEVCGAANADAGCGISSVAPGPTPGSIRIRFAIKFTTGTFDFQALLQRIVGALAARFGVVGTVEFPLPRPSPSSSPSPSPER